MQQMIDEARSLQAQLTQALENLSRIATELNEENNRLTIVNHQLTQQIEELTQQELALADMSESAQENPAPLTQSSGRDRLQTFYDNGIHVCHELFGKRRDSNEQCLFCQDVIDRLNHK